MSQISNKLCKLRPTSKEMIQFYDNSGTSDAIQDHSQTSDAHEDQVVWLLVASTIILSSCFIILRNN